MQVNMRTQSFTPKNQTFKSNITFDIGGSQREGSCKIYYASTPKDEAFYRENTTVNDLGKSKFQNSEDFINQIIKKNWKNTERQQKNRKRKGLCCRRKRTEKCCNFHSELYFERFCVFTCQIIEMLITSR